jgi:osmotically-inducible protein OsmY
MRSDADIKKDVEAELRWAPELDERDISIKVENGIVMLTGFVHGYHEKYFAEAAVKRVKGVLGVADDIQVQLKTDDGAADPEIARAAVAALRATLPVAHEQIKVVVNQGRISLDGTVEWQFQKQQAETAVRYLKGVTNVTNFINVRPRVAPHEIKQRIEEAFRRSAEIDAQRITVQAHNGEVTLKGRVRSWTERNQAQQTAWSAPGVTQVTNEITVSA